ncbi:MAG: hypothetical protein J5642_06305 [Bacteroidales bacterium]|nr:hypothetical protein [Bacteroidales bacterium]
MKKLALTILCIVFWGAVWSQSPLENEAKYWKLRSRLTSEFVYCSGNGMDRGSHQPLEIRFMPNGLRTGYCIDGIWWQGHYVALLATEYALLKRQGKDTGPTLKELHCAIDVYKRLDLAAEKCWGCDTFTQCNGFYLRDDICLADTSRFGLQHLSSGYTSNCGRTSTRGNAPSQDQAWGSYLGFALAQKLVDDESLQQEIGEIAYLMVKGMQFEDESKGERWRIVNPVNGETIQAEMDIQWLQYAHTLAGEKLSGRSLGFGKSDKGNWKNLWNIVQDNILISKYGHFRWYGILALSAVINDSGNGNRDCYQWMLKTCEKIAKRRPDLEQSLIFPHLPLIHAVLYDVDASRLAPRAPYDSYLDAAPVSGAITTLQDGKTLRTPAPWHSLSLFCPWHNTETGESNMIDYMLLYNLVQLVYGDSK